GATAQLQITNDVPHRKSALGIEPDRGFVEKENLRIMGDSSRKVKAPECPTRERHRESVALVFESKLDEQLVRTLASSGTRVGVISAVVIEVLASCASVVN